MHQTLGSLASWLVGHDNSNCPVGPTINLGRPHRTFPVVKEFANVTAHLPRRTKDICIPFKFCGPLAPSPPVGII